MRSITQKIRVSFMRGYSLLPVRTLAEICLSICRSAADRHQKDQDEDAEGDQDQKDLDRIFSEDRSAGLIRLIAQDRAIAGDGDAARLAIILRLALNDKSAACAQQQGGEHKKVDDAKDPLCGS